MVLAKMLSSRSRCSVFVAVSAVSSQHGLVHFDSQYAGLFHSGSSLGRRRRGDWLDGSYCIDVGWSQSCVMGLIRTFPSLSLCFGSFGCCVYDGRVSFALLRCWVFGVVLRGVSAS